MKKLPERDTLYQLYVTENKSALQVAEQLGITRKQVYHALSQYGIERKGKKNPKAPSRDMLYRMYVEENLSAVQIGEKLGLIGGSVFYYLKRYGIERDRTQRNSRAPSAEQLYELYVVQNLPVERVAEIIGYSRSRTFHLLAQMGIERNKRGFKTNMEPPTPKAIQPRPHPYPFVPRKTPIDKEWLRARYLDDNVNTPQIAEELGISSTSVIRTLYRYGIPIKPMHVAFRDKQKRFGDFSASMRKRIWARDHSRCQMCGSTNGSLECHHIIPTRYGGRNSVDNGILLCNTCHDKVGFHELNWAETLLALRGTKTG